MITRRAALALGLTSIALGACGRPASTRGTVKVLYAASLTALMETHFGPTFTRATGFGFEGYAAGSTELANEIAGGVRAADVFVSASPKADDKLRALPAGRGRVAWYAQVAHSPLVVGYNAKSRFATPLRAGPWYQVVLQPGFRLGRTDPTLDPKGTLVVQLAQAEEQALGQTGLADRLLAAGQIFPEQDLVGRLQAGQLDAGFFYQSEAVTVQIPFVAPEPSIDPSAQYTLALPQGGPNPAGAVAFSRFLLGSQGQSLLRAGGLLVGPITIHGDKTAIPAALHAPLGVA